MCGKKEEWSLKVGGILLVKGQLAFKTVPRIIERMDFVYPKGFLIKGVKPEGKAYEKAKNDDKNFLSFYVTHNRESQLLYLSTQSLLFSI